MLKLVEVPGVRAPEVTLKVYPSPAFSMLSPSKVATPLTAALPRLPRSTAPVGLLSKSIEILVALS